jgi:hypothetical protein
MSKRSYASLGEFDNLFVKTTNQTDLEHARWDTFPTLTTLPRDDYATPLEWRVKSTEDLMVDTSPWYLNMVVKILNKDLKELRADQLVAPLCHFLMTQFSSVEVFLNNRQITTPQNTLPWTAYLTALTQFSKEAKNTQLSSSLFYADAYGQHDSTVDSETYVQELRLTPANDKPDVVYWQTMARTPNPNFKLRANLASKSTPICMSGPLLLDLTSINKMLLSKVDITLRLHRARPEFSLMASSGEYVIRVMKADLILRRVKPTRNCMLSLERRLLQSPANYNYIARDMRVLTVSEKISSVDQIVFDGRVPFRITVAQLSQAACDGSLQKNPLNFQHFNMSSIALEVNGRLVPTQTLKTNFKEDYSLAYVSLFHNLGIRMEDGGLGFDQGVFSGGYVIFSFCLCADEAFSQSNYNCQNESGAVRLKITYEKPLAETINVLVLGEFEQQLYIDSKRVVTVG